MENPKTFISYSWSTKEHEDRVLKLAEDLMSQGVDVMLDKWHLREGHESNAFMEKMVNSPDVNKVVIVCDKAYQQKANERKGGVGTETQIISSELYAKQNQDKFVAAVFENDEFGKACTPTYYSSRIYIDFTNPEEEAAQFEQLVRWIYGKPVHVPPPLGKPPSYITNKEPVVVAPTSVAHKRAIDAIKTNKPYMNAALSDYFNDVIDSLELFKPDTKVRPFDEEVVKSIKLAIPLRNEILATFEALAKYAPDQSYLNEVKHFLEHFHYYTDKNENTKSYREGDWDANKFLLHEIFLYLIAILIKRKKFAAASTLINDKYYIKVAHSASKLRDISIFRCYLKSLDIRNERQKTNRISLHADLLKERCNGLSVSFDEVMQADFVIFVARNIHTEDSFGYLWFPITLLYISYHETTFEVFVRGETKAGMENIQALLGISGKEEISKLVQRLESGALKEPKVDSFRPVSSRYLLNYDKLFS